MLSRVGLRFGPPHATLLAFTDGLFERRGESSTTASSDFVCARRRGSLEALLTEIVRRKHPTPRDDVAI